MNEMNEMNFNSETCEIFMERTKTVSTSEFEQMITDLILRRYAIEATHKAEMILDRIVTIQQTNINFNYAEQRQKFCYTKINCGECELYRNCPIPTDNLCQEPTVTNLKIVSDWFDQQQILKNKL